MWLFDKLFKSEYKPLTQKERVLKLLKDNPFVETWQFLEVCPRSFSQIISKLRKEWIDIRCESFYVDDSKGKKNL